MQGVHLRKYGVQTTIDFELYEVDGVDLRVDAVDGGSDCSIMKDEGAEATCTNDFVDEGKGYSIVLTATEMQAARIVLYIVDSVTKVWLDKVIVIETYGNASAMHAIDFSDSVRAGLTALPNAAADAAGGLPISDVGGLDLDAIKAETALIVADTNELQTDDYPTSIAAIKAETALIVADTNELQTDDIPTKIATAQADLDIITGASGVVIQDGTITAAKLGADCITSAKIADDAITAIWAKAMSDLAQGAPSATASVLTAINYLYEAWRNKITTTATLVTVMKDDGTTGLVKSTISDDATTFIKGEMASGA